MEEIWLEAVSAVAADADADLRAEAAEVFAAEAARIRLVDLHGRVRITLRCGQVVAGLLDGDEPIGGHLVVCADGSETVGQRWLIPTNAVVHLDGSRIDLRPELSPPAPRSIGSWLRERWLDGDAISVLDRSAVRHTGSITLVGADHVRLASSRCIPFHAVDAWWS